MTAGRRWCSVALGVLLLIGLPVVVRARPVPDQRISAGTLLAHIRASQDLSYSGLSESAGNVALPANDALSGLTALLSSTNRVRVWWRDPGLWRTATLRATGETDLVHERDRTVRWVYESKQVTVAPDVPVRLPDTADLLPPELARRVLSGARASELRRIPGQRVAGHVALGLRLLPADPQAGIGRVDVYADRRTGVPLRVEVFARHSTEPVVAAHFVDFTPGPPEPSALRFRFPADAEVHYDNIVDLAAAADRFAARIPPRSLAGLPARGPQRGSVGVYGRGPTVLLAIPLWSRTADRVRGELDGRPGVRTLGQGLLVSAVPLQMLLGQPERNGTSWLLAGTVTRRALTDAADQLHNKRPGLRLP
jgi:outer membrane lipoprotein-sorting protein